MSSLAIFQFEGQQVRFVGTVDKPEWVGQDVCAVLGIDRTQMRRLEDYQKGVCTVHTPGGKQELATVKEAGLYALIFTSRKENAKRFQRWVFEEVLPSIRKTGSYSVPSPKPAISYYTDRIIHMRKHLVAPKGYWCVVQKSAHLLLEVEKAGYPIGEYDLLDGSIGLCWSNYRKGKEWLIENRQVL